MKYASERKGTNVFRVLLSKVTIMNQLCVSGADGLCSGEGDGGDNFRDLENAISPCSHHEGEVQLKFAHTGFEPAIFECANHSSGFVCVIVWLFYCLALKETLDRILSTVSCS